MQLEVGAILKGKVTGITSFGAFVQLENGSTGLVHISEVALEYVKDINDHLKENETVKVKVLSIDKEGKISLSIKKALESENKKTSSTAPPEQFWNRPQRDLSFEDKLNRFKQDSDERMQDLRRSLETKRGYRRSSHTF
jgi:S1 RNA binding domain protein